MTLVIVVLVLLLLALLLPYAVKILPEYERGVIFRLGKVRDVAKGPGLFLLIPVIDRMVKVNMQEVLSDVPPQDVITKDGATVKVDAIVYLRVIDAVNAIVEVEDYLLSASQQCVATLRSVCGTVPLNVLLSKRNEVTKQIQEIVDGVTGNWGVKVTRVEITDVILPNEIQRAIAREAEAEREKNAKVTLAKGESEAAQNLAEAARVIAEHPIAYQLRMLQTVSDVAIDKNSTIVLPIPIELLGLFQSAFGAKADRPSSPPTD
jgi:regulator of protease activity HflC (stomatin/prohibitin superfamily)